MNKYFFLVALFLFLLPQVALAGSQTFSYTGADQTFTVPAGVTSLNVVMWGAGGSGYGPTLGGPGGYTGATVTVSPSQQLTVISGQGGVYCNTSSSYGGGGRGRGCGPYIYFSGSAGGRSAVRLSDGTEIMTAGGGGSGIGGSPWPQTGSAGGGASGPYMGSGSQYQGIQEAGGGWVAGGYIAYGGTGNCSSQVSSCTTVGIGSYPPPGPPNTSSADYVSGIAVGGSNSSGGNGIVKISWTDPTLLQCNGTPNIFSYSGSDQFFTIPTGVSSLNAEMWGAGGGGGYNNGGTLSEGAGGAGGYTSATVPVTSGQTYKVIVGSGGRYQVGSGGHPYAGAVAPYGGGGGPNGWSATGGGRSALCSSGGGSTGLCSDSSSELVDAGGGGGGYASANRMGGGAGGGNSGQTGLYGGVSGGSPAVDGGGATQSAGGTTPSQTSCGAAGVGTQFFGGTGSYNTCVGGGGGWFGGGAGAGAGGGSSHCSASVSSCTTTAGNGATPPNQSSQNYASGIAVGGSVSTTAGSGPGGNGLVAITCTPAAPTCSVSLSPNPTAYGSASTLTYSSSNASTFYINNVGYVNSSGSTSVQPSVSTDYTGSAGNGVSTTTCAASLAVTPPSTPAVTISASSTSIYAGQSTNVTATFAAASGSSQSAKVIYLTSGTSWTVPSDWNNSNNTVEVIGGGGGGRTGVNDGNGTGGGGGGGYSKITNLTLTPSGTEFIHVGAAGAANTIGGDTWFNDVNSAATSTTVGVLAKGGATPASQTPGGIGGEQAGNTGGVGSIKNLGGNGGAGAFFTGGGGGGGTAGGVGNGNAGSNGVYMGAGGAGGSGDAGSGGTGGSNGGEWDASHGSGGGGGGGLFNNFPGGPGGNYGAGGGGSGASFGTGGAGSPGLIVITYTPSSSGTDTLTGDNIDSPVGTGLGGNTNPGSKSITFSTTTPGTYTFYARAQTSYYTSWATYASTTVTVLPTCTAAYSCSGQTIQHTDLYCAVTNVTTCTTPYFCSAGSSTCLVSTPTFNTFSSGGSTFTGHLQLLPSLVPQSVTTKLYWNVSNVSSCAVTGTNGDNWTGITSGSGGKVSAPIFQQVVYTLACTGLDNSTFNETQTVNVVPIFQER